MKKMWLGWVLFLLYSGVAVAEPWTIGTIVGLEYPRQALTAGLEGKVELRCNIANDGQVQNIERVSGNAELAAAAEKNALKWKFRRLESGQGSFLLIYHFEIRKAGASGQSVGFRFVLPGDVFVTGEKVGPVPGKP